MKIHKKSIWYRLAVLFTGVPPETSTYDLVRISILKTLVAITIGWILFGVLQVSYLLIFGTNPMPDLTFTMCLGFIVIGLICLLLILLAIGLTYYIMTLGMYMIAGLDFPDPDEDPDEAQPPKWLRTWYDKIREKKVTYYDD